MSASTVFHGGGIDAAAKRFGRPAEDWLDLSTGINPCPPPLPALPPEIWQRLPDSGLIEEARAAAARYYGSGMIPPLPAPGTQVIIRALAAQADRARRVAILAPTYGEYQQVFSDSGFAIDLISNPDEISQDHGVVVVVNPNNPDGRLFQRDELVALAERLQAASTMLIVDEAFGDLVPETSLCGDVSAFSNLTVLRSFGKFFGYAGLRLAFAVAGPKLADPIARFLGPWPVSGPALTIGKSLMEGDIEGLRSSIRAQRLALGEVLSEAGLSVAGGTDLFALVQHRDAFSLFEHLAGEGILTRAFDYRPDWLRVGLFANAEEGYRLADALGRFAGS